jgi:hypothetical protein
VKIYLGSPGNQLQADAVRDQRVLISFASWQKFKPLTDWAPSFNSVLLDSGAYSELNSGVKIKIHEYIEWTMQFPWCDHFAGLDDISGNWKRSLENYKHGGFPTYHDTDPPELLSELIPLARERVCKLGKSRKPWLGIGLLPPRTGRNRWLRETLERIPEDIHVHGWALGAYTHHARIDSIDSTHWWREAMKYRTKMPWLTYGETLEIAVKKVSRVQRITYTSEQQPLFASSHPKLDV